MKKYTIHNEQSSPSDEAITKQKDFGKLLGNYEKVTKRPKKPIYKDPKYLLFIVLLLVLAFVVFEVFDEEEKKDINTYESIDTHLTLPFDTNKVIEMMDIKLYKGSDNLPDSLVTIKAKNHMFACGGCPDWSLYNSENKSENKQFFYIQPANKNIDLDDDRLLYGNIIEFKGKFICDTCLPNTDIFMRPDPPKWKVFEYHAYKAIGDVSVYGPNVIDRENGNPDDDFRTSNIITIKQLTK